MGRRTGVQCVCAVGLSVKDAKNSHMHLCSLGGDGCPGEGLPGRRNLLVREWGIQGMVVVIFYLQVEGREGLETVSVEREMRRHSVILLDSLGISGAESRVSFRAYIGRETWIDVVLMIRRGASYYLRLRTLFATCDA